jgi:hypothetical protein
VLSFNGGNILLLLGRRNGHSEFDGLIVHNLIPKAGAPLTGLSSTIGASQFSTGGSITIP